MDTAEPQDRLEEVPLVWDDARMATSFANVVNIHSTREQVDILFGTNASWDPTRDATIRVDLTNRIIMSPHAAKRLSVALAGVLAEYERRHGPLTVG